MNDALSLGARVRAAQHDLNNPLTALLAEAQLLALDPLSDEQQESVERMVGLVRRIVILVQTLDSTLTPHAGGG